MLEIKQLKFSDVEFREFDLYVAASGFESRAIYQISRYKGNAKRKIVFAFNNQTTDNTRIENDIFFKEKGFIEFITDGDVTKLVVFEDLVCELDKELDNDSDLNIYVDYSSMTRNIYAQILHIIKNLEISRNINVVFSYSHAIYTKSLKEEVLNRVVEPIFGYCNLSIPIKPTALIVCLGNEKSRVYGLQEYFDAATYLFYTDSSFDNQFSREVEEVNFDILRATNPENIIKFPIYDLIYTNHLLQSVCRVLSNEFRVIIAPCGPKPFTLLALLNCLLVDLGVEVWRISPGKGLPKIEREPNGEITVLEAKFLNRTNLF